jgi:hypothetical protein
MIKREIIRIWFSGLQSLCASIFETGLQKINAIYQADETGQLFVTTTSCYFQLNSLINHFSLLAPMSVFPVPDITIQINNQ